MPKMVRVYSCRSYDEILGIWSTSKHRYTLEEIARLHWSEPIMDDWEDVERPTDDEIWTNRTSALWRD